MKKKQHRFNAYLNSAVKPFDLRMLMCDDRFYGEFEVKLAQHQSEGAT